MVLQSVLKVNETIDLSNALEGAITIVKLVKPDWTLQHISSKMFQNGITNKMLGFFYKDDEASMILLRINGEGTELFLDRAEEVRSFEILHKYDCAPCLYCVFNNGLCYEYIQGQTLTKESVRNPAVYKQLTAELAKMHSIPSPENTTPQPNAFSRMRRFIAIAYSPSGSEPQNNSLNVPLQEKLDEEVDELEKQLLSLNSPVTFCHNDLLLHNIIYNEKTDSIKFIDYEYAGFNCQAYDIGNHFCEFAGIDDVDYSLYPSKEFQFEWLRCYLTAYQKHNYPDQPVEEEDMTRKIRSLYSQVNKFALAAHLFWGIWALVQARYSKIDFDYNEYSRLRLSEYHRRKDEFLSL